MNRRSFSWGLGRTLRASLSATLALLTCLGVWPLASVHAAQPFVNDVGGTGVDAEVSFQTAETDSADGSVFVAGTYRGSAQFSGAVGLTSASTAVQEAFLAKRTVSGAWEWAVRAYVPPTAAAENQSGALTTATTSQEVRDIEVTPTGIYLAGTLRGSTTSRAGWVAKFNRSGVLQWTRYFLASDVTVNAVGVNAEDGSVYVGGGFTSRAYTNTRANPPTGGVPRRLEIYNETGRTRLADTRSIDGERSDYDAFVVKFNDAGAYQWRVLGGSPRLGPFARDYDNAGGEKLVAPEETVAVEVDGAGTLHVLMNVGGSDALIADSAVQLFNRDDTLFTEFNTGCYIANGTQSCATGAMTPVAGRISANGNWEIHNDLSRDDDLAAAAKQIQALGSPFTRFLGRDLTLVDGKVVVVGGYQYGTIDFQTVIQWNARQGFMVRVSAETYAADGPAVYFKSLTEEEGRVTEALRVRGAGERIHVTGHMERTMQVFSEANHATATLGPYDAEVTSLVRNEFLATFDPDFTPLQLHTTTLANEQVRPDVLDGSVVAYDAVRDRVYWGGRFGGNRRLVLGDVPIITYHGPTTLSSDRSRVLTRGWLTVFDGSGHFALQSTLSVHSDFQSVRVDGVEFAGTDFTLSLFQNTDVTLSVPEMIPSVLDGVGTRQLARGFRVNGSIVSGSATSYSLKLLQDTSVVFEWETQHRLTIASDHADAGLSDKADAGSASPPIGDTWIKAGDLVTAFVDGLVLPVDLAAVGTRWIATGFTASGSVLNSVDPSASVIAGSNPFGRVEVRHQVPQFTMDGPGSIQYHWGKQYRVQVSSSNEDANNLVLSRQTTATATSYTGIGEFWFDDGSTIELGAQQQGGNLSLRGWRNADPIPGAFPDIQDVAPDGNVASIESHFSGKLTKVTIAGVPYLVRTLTDFSAPVRVTWDFGDAITRQDLALGQSMTPPAGALTGRAPLAVRLVDAPPASSADDMVIWDDVANRLFPLRPGIVLIDWPTTTGKLVSQIFAGFPGTPIPQRTPAANFSGAPHYQHISQTPPQVTPPVDLDPDTTDPWYFLRMPYGEGTAQVVDKRFTSRSPGMAVLLFSESTDPTVPATGDLAREVLRVRVVNTRDWQTALGAESDSQPAGFLSGVSPVIRSITGGGIVATRTLVADFDQDGRPDVLHGRNGASPAGNLLLLNSGQRDPLTAAQALSAGLGGVDIAVGDVNGDGYPDLVEAYASGPRQVFLNNRTADPFANVTGLPIGPADGISQIQLGDVNGDGRLDLVASRTTGATIEVFYNTGAADAFPSTPSVVFSLPGFAGPAQVIAVGDLNNDGRADLAAGRGGQGVFIFLNGGGANPFGAAARQLSDSSAPLPREIRFADVNRDGRPDLVWFGTTQFGAFSAGILTHLNNGGPTVFDNLTSRILVPSILGPARQIVVEDVNGDGLRDLLITTGSNFESASEVRLITNNGAGFNSLSLAAISPILQASASLTTLAVADLNNDQAPEVITGGLTELDLLINQGDLRRYRNNVTIGTRVSSGYDRANLHTGYLIHEKALYNADIYQRSIPSGPIIPVNRFVHFNMAKPLVVVWYQKQDSILWPYQPVLYQDFQWPTAPVGRNPEPNALKRIVIASRLGSEGLDGAGNRQLIFDPARYSQLKIYNQPDRSLPGFNPNEEHARIYPSLLGGVTGLRTDAAFALRNDLNISVALIQRQVTSFNFADYTSDPYVLLQYFDQVEKETKMAVYAVERDAPGTFDERLASLPGSVGNAYAFTYQARAGELIQPPYPLNLVQGLQPCVNTVPNLFSVDTALPNGSFFADGDPAQRTWMVDHKGAGWVVSGDSFFFGSFYYRLPADFWYPFNKDSRVKHVGDCVPFLPEYNLTTVVLGAYDTRERRRLSPLPVQYNTSWPDNPATLKVGETLTFAGGEYHADHPEAPGLPGVVGWASGEIVYDSKNPAMQETGSPSHVDSFMARLVAPLETRQISLPLNSIRGVVSPASPDIIVDGDTWRFAKLPPSLQKRIFYQPLAKLKSTDSPGVLGIRGYVNNKTLGDDTLTATPPPVYLVEPNVLNRADKQLLEDLFRVTEWRDAVRQLFDLSQNPTGLDLNADSRADTGRWDVGLQPSTVYDATGTTTTADNHRAKPLTGLGPGLALVTNPKLLSPAYRPATGWVTLVENNHPSLGDAPVTLHVIRVDPTQLYRGAIQTQAPDNAFDEKLTLIHTADFAGNVEEVAYAWWYHEADGTVQTGQVPPGTPPAPVWNPFADAAGVAGQNLINLNSNPVLLLADNLFFVRYRLLSDVPAATANWSDWAGAANSTIADLDGDSRPDFRAQLAMGWVKRVLDAINPYEARVRDLTRNESPATAASLVQQLGAPFVGPVALNASKNVVENLGLIELYETLLKRARDLSIDATQPASTPGIDAAILLASTRLADFYTLLGHEAWDDALDPTLGFGYDTVGGETMGNASLFSSRFCFENQLPSLLDEELALLRGVDESFGRPVYNRLFWNFTKGEGEVAYALNYQIADVNHDGFLDENDARVQYPQGHGDAWGHYLSAMRKRYDLLLHSQFDWDARSEFYNLLDVVIGVDFLDERKFAQTAAARAKVGSEIVNLTFRSRYTEDPAGQWQGYLDTDTGRAWGVTEWARRAGQAAYLDWLTANALMPYRDPDSTHTGIERIDRQNVGAIAEVSAQFAAIQLTLDASNNGLNPLGLDPEVVPFDLDPTHIDVGSTAQIGREPVQGQSHYEQIRERAFEAVRNASLALAHANDQKARLRSVAASADRLRQQAIAQDLEYRNRLIEIFGTPYTGTIGAGKPYPPGYNGPDLNLYMYVDVNALNNDTVPAPAESYAANFARFHELFGDIVAPGTATAKELIERYYRKHNFGDGNGSVEDNNLTFNTNVELLGDGFVLHLDLPATAGDYTFVAPTDWGQRAAPGRLQTQVSEILQAEADLTLSVGDYDFFHKLIRDQVEYLEVRILASGQIIANQEDLAEVLKQLNEEIRFQLLEAGNKEALGEFAGGIGESVAEAFPEENGTSNDFTFAGRSISLFLGSLAKMAFDLGAAADEGQALEAEHEKEHEILLNEIETAKLELGPELVGIFNQIEELLVNEGVTRVRVFSARERLRGLLDQYRATLQEGLRLLEERRNANVGLAAATQGNRYHDTLFRSARHESIDRYRALYDLAQRYTYMATKAYDYETNFDPNDRASAQGLLSEICRERALGEIADNQPLNRGGLAGILARLQANFRAVEGRLGFNNFQFDTTSFSLRQEMARASTETSWRTRLGGSQVTDLWLLPEFRRYCRPFAPRSTTAQPGIVLRFGTQVRAAKNYFGQTLGPGDSAFDPTVYATKIRSTGVQFVDYPLTALARTPYVYLVPVGLDTMTIPDSPTLETRTWNVVDQAIPAPFLTGAADLGRPNWLPLVDSLSGPLGAQRRFSSFRAGVLDGDPELNATRLIGRSVWNTGWMLIIPGQTLHADPAVGLREFISRVSDIRLTFETYGYSGN